MSLKKHIEQFEETLLDEKVNNPTSKNTGLLQEHIVQFEKSLGESPIRKSTSNKVSFGPIEQLQLKIRDKNKIIENLETKTFKLSNQVATLENEKFTILKELNKSKWLESKITSNSKKIYEDKIKEMSILDSTKLIPMLIEVARKKQGNEILNWGKWLEIAENKYLLQINEGLAKKVFNDNNEMIKQYVGNINLLREKSRTRGTAWSLTRSIEFTGDTNAQVATGNYVSTTFDPDDYNLNQGFTVSYWVKPLELGGYMFALGRKPHDDSMFMFGIRNSTNYQASVGNNKKDNQAHGMEVGNWYHWVVTYAGHASGAGDRDRIVYKNGVKLVSSVDNGFAGTVRWPDSQKGVYAGGTSAADGGQYIYFGARSNTSRGTFESGAAGPDGHPYDNGWNCRLTDVSIFNEPKDQSWVTKAYNNGKPTDLTQESGLVGYWIFENDANDLSGEGNHGTASEVDGIGLGTGAVVYRNDVPGE